MTDLSPLMPHQREVIQFGKSRHKTIVAHGMRLGKTRSAITYADEMNAFPVLVVCPASLRWVWADEIQKWAPHLRAQVLLDGTDRFKKGAHFHIVSYEYITKTKQMPLSRFRLVIVDEAHFLKNLEAKRTQRLWQIIDHVPLAFLMSGTIIPSRPVELYTTLRMVGAINMDYITYTERYCDAHPTDWGRDVTGASNLEALSKILRPFMHYRTKEMVLDELPETSRQVIALNLPLDAREKEFDMNALKRTEDPIAFEGLTDLMVFIGQQKAPETIHFIEDLLTRVSKVVVFFTYHTTADLLREGLRQYGVAEHHGRNTKTRKAEIEQFQTDPDTRIILVQVKTAIGISLWAADTTVFAEASWVPGELEQAEERVTIIHGTPQPTMHYYMTIHNSVDEHQLRRTLEKKEVIDQIMNPEAAIL